MGFKTYFPPNAMKRDLCMVLTTPTQALPRTRSNSAQTEEHMAMWRRPADKPRTTARLFPRVIRIVGILLCRSAGNPQIRVWTENARDNNYRLSAKHVHGLNIPPVPVVYSKW